MKKFLFTMIALLGIAVSSQAMSYEQARRQALFLADKMAYELNLTEEQYEACYEVNLDYFMRITTVDDLYGDFWIRRNLDLSYILLDWQYRTFLNASYFYRPIYWSGGYWHFGIYARYPHRHYYYFGRPAFWSTYRGAHSWHSNGGRSWYHGRDFTSRGFRGNGRSNRGSDYQGMRDGFNNGNYGRGHNFGRDNGSNRSVTTRGQSSTRSTVGTRGFNNLDRANTTVNRPNAGLGVDRGVSNRNGNTTFTKPTERQSVSRDRSSVSTEINTRNRVIDRSNSTPTIRNSTPSIRNSTPSVRNSSPSVTSRPSTPSTNRPVRSSVGRPTSTPRMGSGATINRSMGSPSIRSGSRGGGFGGGTRSGGSPSGSSHGGGRR
jgi:hypothetical protein